MMIGSMKGTLAVFAAQYALTELEREKFEARFVADMTRLEAESADASPEGVTDGSPEA